MSGPALATARLFALATALVGCASLTTPSAAEPAPARPDGAVRFATYNIAMGLNTEGELARRAAAGNDPALQRVAAVIRTVRPDVLLLNEFDHDPAGRAPRDFVRHYLAAPGGVGEPIDYPYVFAAPSNTGEPSGLDLDGDGRTDGPGDAWGFGRFPGQFAMAVLSRLPIDEDAARTFRLFRHAALPGAGRPVNPDGTPFHDEATWAALRLSSKSHWDLPIRVGDATVHLLASHPTPPVFDGPENRNGLRNADEIRLWAEYVSGADLAWLTDDQGRDGGLDPAARFVIAGDLNADPVDGDSTADAVGVLLNHPRIDAGACVPASAGGAEAGARQGGVNAVQQGDPAHDTADFGDAAVGNLRLDYVLPSKGLEVLGCGVYWPVEGTAGAEAASVSDHRMVWIDLRAPSSGE